MAVITFVICGELQQQRLEEPQAQQTSSGCNSGACDAFQAAVTAAATDAAPAVQAAVQPADAAAPGEPLAPGEFPAEWLTDTQSCDLMMLR